MTVTKAEVGTNNFISKAQRNNAQRPFRPVKMQRKMRKLISEAQRNSAIAKRYFRLS